MKHQPDRVHARAGRYLSQYLPDAVVRAAQPLRLSSWVVPDGENGAGEPVTFDQMLAAASFEPTDSGAAWGRAWGTTWFSVAGTVPSTWPGGSGPRDPETRIELSIDLGFNQAKPGFQAEGLVRTERGVAVKGLEPRHHHVPVTAGPGEDFAFYVEAASNPDVSGGDDFKGPRAYAPTTIGDKLTASDELLYRLGRIEVRLIDTTTETLIRELTVLSGLMMQLESFDPRQAKLATGIDAALDVLDPNDASTGADRAREILAPLLQSPANASAHSIIATGHAHIDSAWLWPTRESVRKVTRTFANVLALMDADPEVTFTCSSAQHFAWVRDHDPELFERVRHRVAQGRFIPVGNMWVESDVNMPSGESLARQFLYGARFFAAEFGQRSDVGWLPDSFGYPASLPQLLKGAGLKWFFTQKMCWNDTNTFPHHSFKWEGLDGTSIFTHFPPNNTYSGDMRPVELARSVHYFNDHAGASSSLMPFGYGDGGGGPTREMIADARLQSNLEGSAKMRLGTAREFFADAEAEYESAPVWSGEMYLEFHRGIYTSQARTKAGNRRNEALLVQAEMWCAAASVRTGAPYPTAEFEELWQQVLLLQFHDILPGTSIAWVHREAEATHERVTTRLRQIIDGALSALAGPGERELTVNPAPIRQGEIAGWSASADPAPAPAPITVEPVHGGVRLVSDALAVSIDDQGAVHSIIDLRVGRELLPPGQRAAVLGVNYDAPTRWDAWDLDRSALNATQDLRADDVRIQGSAVVASYSLDSTTLTNTFELSPDGTALQVRTAVNWTPARRLLTMSIPLDLRAQDAAHETQFGHVRRPLSANTSWEQAQYESCAHRWVHVGEPGYGVVVANDAGYGHDVSTRADGDHAFAVVRRSLLRATTFPDPDADQGHHEMTTLIAPAVTTTHALRAAQQLNAPTFSMRGGHAVDPLVRLGGPAGGPVGGSASGSAPAETTAELSAVKLAADGSGDLIIRLYEGAGGRTRAAVSIDAELAGVAECDLTEEVIESGAPLEVDGSLVTLDLRPFQVRTLRIAIGQR